MIFIKRDTDKKKSVQDLEQEFGVFKNADSIKGGGLRKGYW